jgi:hypothetical protein
VNEVDLRSTTEALRRELEAARAEAAALRDSLAASVVASPPETGGVSQEEIARLVSDTFAEMEKVRAESLRARKELERQRTTHRAEMIQARAKYNSAHEKLQELVVRRTQAGAVGGSAVPKRVAVAAPTIVVSRRKPIGKLVAVSVAVACVVTGLVILIRNPPEGLAWPKFRSPVAEVAVVKQPVVTEAPAAVPPRPPPLPVRVPEAQITAASQSRFQGAVARLNLLLASSGGRPAQEVLREVHEKYKAVDPTVCDFDWRKGQPALMYAGGGGLSLGQTIEHCADAVERNR